MKKKSIAAFGLAALLTVGTCLPVMAATNTTEGTTEITYEVSPTYQVEIPTAVTMTGAEDKVTVVLKNDGLLLDEGGSVKVDIADSHTDRKVTLSNGKTTNLSVTVGAASASDLTTGEATCDFSLTADTPAKAGTYTGAVNFTVSYTQPTA